MQSFDELWNKLSQYLPRRDAYERVTDFTVYYERGVRRVFEGPWRRFYQKADPNPVGTEDEPLLRADPGAVKRRIDEAEECCLEWIDMKRMMERKKPSPAEVEERIANRLCVDCGKPLHTSYPDGRKLPPDAKFCPKCAGVVERLAKGQCGGCANPMPAHGPDGRKMRSDAKFCPECVEWMKKYKP